MYMSKQLDAAGNPYLKDGITLGDNNLAPEEWLYQPNEQGEATESASVYIDEKVLFIQPAERSR